MLSGTRIIGYVRVSTREQGLKGAGLAAQRTAIKAEAKHRGWKVIGFEEDVSSGKTTNGRPGLQRAIDAIEDGRADAIVAAKLDRLSRSTLDFLRLVDRSQKSGWSIAVLDMGGGETLDLTTPLGKMTATILAGFAQFERDMIVQRTRDGLAQKKAEGVVLGRPATLDKKVVQHIVRMRKRDETLRSIADRLNHDGVPTAQGGKRWYPATVGKVLARHERATG